MNHRAYKLSLSFLRPYIWNVLKDKGSILTICIGVSIGGHIFFPWSAALIFGSLSFILVTTPLEILFMLVMIKLVEEPEAIHKFGDAYREYQQQVPMFNLSPKCWLQILKEN